MAANTNFTQLQILILVLIAALFTNGIMAQRPSFAGSRPAGGLNQKDKYHSTSTQSNTDFENRFGGSDASTISNQIPFGQPQKPPVGYPVVVPESIYTALIAPTRPSSAAAFGTNNVSTGVVFEDRFGETDNNTPASASSPSSSSSSSTTSSSRVPLDAHGDQLLIDQLNQIPVDKRPFWFINYQAIEAQRNGSGNNFAGAQGSRGSFFG